MISPGTPVGGPAGASTHPGASPKAAGGKVGQETQKICTAAAHVVRAVWMKSLPI